MNLPPPDTLPVVISPQCNLKTHLKVKGLSYIPPYKISLAVKCQMQNFDQNVPTFYFTKESLLKGKDQYVWPFLRTHSAEPLLLLCLFFYTKHSTLIRRSFCTGPSPSLSVPWSPFQIKPSLSFYITPSLLPTLGQSLAREQRPVLCG